MKLSENIIKSLLFAHEKNGHVIESGNGLLLDYKKSVEGYKAQIGNLQEKVQESEAQNQEIEEMLEPYGSIEQLQDKYRKDLEE